MDLPLLHPSCGSRIRYNGHTGTVKYVGPVDNTAGTWLGIEWDDPERGKHDGVKDNKCYFSCRFPRSGSFIRPSSNVLFGISFLQGLSSKYTDELHGSGSQETVVLGSSQGTIQVEAVGLDKIRDKLARLERLRNVSLDGTLVASADPPGQIRDTCPNIRNLDLSLTLIPSWEVIVQIAAEVPLLERLSLNQNRFSPLRGDEPWRSAFLNLTEIQLNGCLLTWSEAQTIIGFMPRLRSLEVGYNHLASLAVDNIGRSVPHLNLQTLNLDNNELSDWSEIVQTIPSVPHLAKIILSFNKINTITAPKDAERLAHLKYLAFASNGIASWLDLEALSEWCPVLESISLRDNPLMEHPQARPLIIARLPALLTLDGTSISAKERQDSEIFYLADVARRRRSIPGVSPILPCFRWDELCKKYGAPQEGAKEKHDDKLSSRLLSLNLAAVAGTPNKHYTIGTSDGVSLKVLPSMVLRSLRVKVKRLSQGRAKDVTLWMGMYDGSWVELSKADDSRTLDWIGLENGSQIGTSVPHTDGLAEPDGPNDEQQDENKTVQRKIPP